MRQMGIKTEQLEATRVIIETSSGRLVVEEPQVIQITAQGQKSFQISGQVRSEAGSEEDVKMVMEQTGCSEEEAKAALEKTKGDIAQAILMLTEGKE